MTESINATFHYRCVYAVEGVIDPDPGLNHQLLQNENVEVRILGSSAYEQLVEVIISQLEQKGKEDSGERARKKLELRRNSLIHQAGRRAIVCVESSLPADVIKNYHEDNSELPAYTKSPLKQNAERAFKVTSAAITLARGSHLSRNYDFINEQYYIRDHQSRVICWLHPTSVSDIGPMSELNIAEIHVAEKLASTLYGDSEITKILDLYSDSLTPYKSGHLYAFIAAWTALEMFIAKQFKEIQSSITISINGAEANKEFSDRMISVMTDKYRLVDKFSALSGYYGDTNADKDLEELKSIKKIRDDFFHTMKGDVADLPLNRIRLLISKYLQIYFERNHDEFVFQRASEA
ncbi:hypothetical protein [Delftia sp. UME58]|uniref:hypothetical protein n=1 Tax=Delftia sp. UME58 TaxID=1862322 RepID=UPI001600BE8B|nr:hypothetical protein [Delftia sp. UME58]